MTSNRSVSEMVERAAVEAALARAYSRFGDVLAVGAAIGMVRDEIAASSQAQSDDVVERVAEVLEPNGENISALSWALGKAGWYPHPDCIKAMLVACKVRATLNESSATGGGDGR